MYTPTLVPFVVVFFGAQRGMLETALIVDARVSTRKKLARQCRDSGVAANVVEAISVFEGLSRLESDEFDACLLGAGLSTHVAIDFVREGISATKKESCAFIIVRKLSDSQRELFLRAGVHGVFDPTASRRSFSDIVKQAVKRAGHGTQSMSAGASEHLRALIDSQSAVGAACDELQRSLCDILSGTSAGLRHVARGIASGTLSMRSDGAPSLATKDAIRSVFEAAIGADRDITAPDDFDRLFLQALCEWFVDRVEVPQSEAALRLRRKLVSFQNSYQRH